MPVSTITEGRQHVLIGFFVFKDNCGASGAGKLEVR